MSLTQTGILSQLNGEIEFSPISDTWLYLPVNFYKVLKESFHRVKFNLSTEVKKNCIRLTMKVMTRTYHREMLFLFFKVYKDFFNEYPDVCRRLEVAYSIDSSSITISFLMRKNLNTKKSS